MKREYDIKGFNISIHKKSNRILEVELDDILIDKLVFPFNKFDITALEISHLLDLLLAKA
jgi:hypothetical protein